MSLKLATPEDARAAIEAIPAKVVVPGPWGGKVDGRTLQLADKLMLLGGFRVSEVVTEETNGDTNTAESLELTTDTHYETGEEVLKIGVYALKKSTPVKREIGVPLNPRFEPFSRDVLKAWDDNDGRNPCSLDRIIAAKANRIVFEGLGYKIRKKGIVVPAANHFLRHMREWELRSLQVDREERTAFFSWSTRNLEGAEVQDEYGLPEWFEYFHKLLRPKI